MRSIKPGRAPSAMNAVGSVIGIVFGIFWTILAFAITRDSPFPLVGVIFPLFGLVFIGAGVVNLWYNAHNAVGRNRFSTFDITSETEEPDPLMQRVANRNLTPQERAGRFCPYCGGAITPEFTYCPKCGRRL